MQLVGAFFVACKGLLLLQLARPHAVGAAS